MNSLDSYHLNRLISVLKTFFHLRYDCSFIKILRFIIVFFNRSFSVHTFDAIYGYLNCIELIIYIQQAQHERNFHVFYALRFAKDRFSDLQLDEQKFHYLNEPNCSENDINNLANFDELTEAFNDNDFTQEQQEKIAQILAGILHLGNVNLVKSESGGESQNAESCFISVSYLVVLIHS